MAQKRDLAATIIPDLLTVDEVADRMRVTGASVRRWIRAGELRAIKAGKEWRIATAEVTAYLKRQETAPSL